MSLFCHSSSSSTVQMPGTQNCGLKTSTDTSTYTKSTLICVYIVHNLTTYVQKLWTLALWDSNRQIYLYVEKH